MDLNAVDLIIVDTIPTVTGDAIDFKQEREKRAEMAAQACVAHSARFYISCLKQFKAYGVTR